MFKRLLAAVSALVCACGLSASAQSYTPASVPYNANSNISVAWQAGTYYQGDIRTYTDGCSYVSQKNGNTDTPGATANWAKLGCAATGGIALQHNGTANGSQSKLNLVPGTNVTISEDGSGDVTIGAIAGSGPSTVVYTSQLSGVHPVSAIVAGTSASGYADSMTAINSALATLSAAGGGKLVVDGKYGQGSTLSWPSNVEIDCLPGDGFIMLPASNAVMIENSAQLTNPSSCAPTVQDGTSAGFVVGAPCNSNLVMRGCYLNMNAAQSLTANADQKTQANGKWAPGFQLAGVNHWEIHDTFVNDAGIYAYAATNFTNGELDHADCQGRVSNPNSGTGPNTDCWHFNGPFNFVRGHDSILGPNGDDPIATNCWDWYSPGNTGPYGSYTQFNAAWQQGPCQHAHFYNVVLNNTRTGPRVLVSGSGGTPSSDITFDHITGTTTDRIGEIDNYSNSGACNVTDLSFTNIDIQRGNSTSYGGDAYDYYVHCNISTFTFANVHSPSRLTALPLLWIDTGSTVNLINMPDLTIDNVTGTQNTTQLIQTDGVVNAIGAPGVIWKDAVGNTGHLFGGATAPGWISAGSFIGDTTRVSGYSSPGTQTGDAFGASTPTTTYVATSFTEGAAGASLNGTKPATTVGTNAWTDSCGSSGFTYKSGGGLASQSGTGGCDAVITTGQPSNFTMRATITNTTGNAGFQLKWNYTDTTHFYVLIIDSSDFKIATYSAGTLTSIANASSGTCPTVPLTGTYVLKVSGTSVTATNGSCSVTATGMTTPTSSTVGFADFQGTALTVNSFSVANQ